MRACRAACVRAQRMDVFSSPYGIRLDESAPPDKCLGGSSAASALFGSQACMHGLERMCEMGVGIAHRAARLLAPVT